MIPVTSTSEHQQKVDRIRQAIVTLRNNGQQAKMYHGSTNSTRPPIVPGLQLIDVSGLTEILEINSTEQYVLVEPNVPLDKLVVATNAYGLMPPVVAEFPGITVGGAVQGGSGESSSHQYGLFADTCLEYEVVLGDGSQVVCSPLEKPDLYGAMSGAFGSLGVLTAVKVKLVPAPRYVALTYIPTSSHADMISKIHHYSKPDADFVDGILFSQDFGVVIIGKKTDKAVAAPVRFSRFWDEWFYIHAKKMAKMNGHASEVTLLADYLFRYDRGAFWVAKYGFGKTPFNRFTRVIFSSVFKTRTLFKLMHSSGYAYVFVAQDICLPSASALDFLKYCDNNLNVYPLWVCPLKPTDDKLAPTNLKTDMVINIGVWGAMKPASDTFTDRNRALERIVAKLSGRKVLYAHAYYTPEEFWLVYSRKWYENIRRKYGAGEVFPDVYRKIATKPPVNPPSRMRGLRGLLKSPYKL